MINKDKYIPFFCERQKKPYKAFLLVKENVDLRLPFFLFGSCNLFNLFNDVKRTQLISVAAVQDYIFFFQNSQF